MERIFSTPLLLAASISVISSILFCSILLQTSHLPQGFPSEEFIQFIALAKILAQDVLPVPFEPVNKYACDILFDITSFFKVLTT